MRIVEPSVTLITPGTREEGMTFLRTIEGLARISHRSEDRQTPDSWQRFIKAIVVDHGDWSVVEHSSATAIFRVDRGVTHELVRHRHFSFTQESTRFVNGRKAYPAGLEFIRPSSLHLSKYSDFEWACEDSEKSYFLLLEEGERPQEARSVLPNALASTIAMTGNLRAWRWFFQARTTQESHPDMRQIVTLLLAQFKERIPILYDDLETNLKQSISMAKVH